MVTPTDALVIKEDVVLEPGTYLLPHGMSIEADRVTVQGNGATIIGESQTGQGLTVRGRHDVTIQNLILRHYRHGIYAQDCRNLNIQGCHITGTAELPPNTDFLDIWRPVEESYGGGILLDSISGGVISGNSLMHQMNGLLTYHCRDLEVKANNASYSSGFGFHLYDTSDSHFVENFADYCCRYQPRGEGWGHLGADAAGFLIVAGSSRNHFLGNVARMGGDGFFLAGLSPQFEMRPCNDNKFEKNDGSYSPNIAFEATFSTGNIFRENKANFSNYGFWLGFSSQNTLDANDIYANRGAGVAVENGVGFVVEENTIRGNGHGLLLWSKHVPQFEMVVPDNNTSRDWLITRNTFAQNGKAIRIAADQDHGIRPHTSSGPAPSGHIIQGNRFERGTSGVELAGATGTKLEDNIFEDIQQKVRYL